jgi:excinuclease ABC subunit C
LEGLAERFGLTRPPRRIEVFDNSHIMGTSAVGAMIVAGPDGFVKGQYRKFNIKSADLTPGDDYAMMREVLTRRYKRLTAPRNAASSHDDSVSADVALRDVEPVSLIEQPEPPPITERGADGIPFGVLRADHVEEPPANAEPVDTSPALFEDDEDADDELLSGSETDEFPDRPDLVLIDGGAGQLSIAVEVFRDLGLTDIPLVGVAKGPDRDAGREHFHIPGSEKPFMLEPRDPVLYFVQRLRDEAHRFVIGTHRAKRSKAISANPLDEIPGIGPTRKRALLQHFGSAKAVSRAGVADLKDVPGVSAQMAQTIYDFFHERKT